MAFRGRTNMSGHAFDAILASLLRKRHSLRMSTKQIVADLLQKLPENVSLREVTQEIEFVPAVRQSLAKIERGERIPIAEIERVNSSWVIK